MGRKTRHTSESVMFPAKAYLVIVRYLEIVVAVENMYCCLMVIIHVSRIQVTITISYSESLLVTINSETLIELCMLWLYRALPAEAL